MELRWQAAPDTVRKILRLNGVDPGGRKSLLIPLTDLLACEGISDPLNTWIFSSEDERKILSAGLLTLSEVGALPDSPASLHPDTFYRHIADGRLPSIRIGNQHRFRRDITAAESWLEKAWRRQKRFHPFCQRF